MKKYILQIIPIAAYLICAIIFFLLKDNRFIHMICAVYCLYNCIPKAIQLYCDYKTDKFIATNKED